MKGASASQASDLATYKPSAVYYDESDRVEYVRADVPCVYRRVDNILTLVLAMQTREPVGFQIKGFKHLYLEHVKRTLQKEDTEFLRLIKVLEIALTTFGDTVFDNASRKHAYEEACGIASKDNVGIRFAA